MFIFFCLQRKLQVSCYWNQIGIQFYRYVIPYAKEIYSMTLFIRIQIIPSEIG